MLKQIFIDVETTGLDEVEHGLVQVAGKIVIDRKVKKEFNYYMCPPSSKGFQQKALEVIGMDIDKIKSFPSSHKMYDKFFSMLKRYINIYDKKDKFHFIAYNSPFDSMFIRQWFKDNNNEYYGSMFWTPDLCVMRDAGIFLQNSRSVLKNFKLETVCESLNIEAKGDAHDAMFDINLTIQLFEYINYGIGAGNDDGDKELKLL